ncbi:hypothetical protein, partial [Enterobacter hormaechei]|uniref:hypothetical protein n=1 Tax=Enterobacter hormaechei TaxID=158836 RepID=UPI000B17F6B9
MFPLTPALSLKGEGAVCAGIILWGTLSPPGEGENTKNGNGCYRFAFTLQRDIRYRLAFRLRLQLCLWRSIR